MLDRFINQGRADALRRFGFDKLANMELGAAGMPTPHAMPQAAPPAGGMGGGMLDKAKAFGSGQLGAAKDLFGNLRQGLGGAATPELGQSARAGAVGNLKTLAPSLLAGGALYAMSRHRDQQAREAGRARAMDYPQGMWNPQGM